MLTESLEKLFTRDLDVLANEIGAFTREADLWKTIPGITNSAGNLCLHLCGNLKHFIGAILGKTDYVRQRELEFSTKNTSLPTLIAEVASTREVVISTLQKLSVEDFQDVYPVSLWNDTFSTEFFLIHLHSHLNYHLGQINYLRRVIEG